jgi:hypothetical protein
MQRLFAALRTNPHDRDRLFGTFAGTVPADEYFAPHNLERILEPLAAAACAGSELMRTAACAGSALMRTAA